MSVFYIMKDCFAYCKKTKKCNILRNLYCKYEDCTFYKTKEQFESDLKQSQKRKEGKNEISEYIPCYVNGRKALFHRWNTRGMVEYENGTIEEVEPSRIEFCYNKM